MRGSSEVASPVREKPLGLDHRPGNHLAGWRAGIDQIHALAAEQHGRLEIASAAGGLVARGLLRQLGCELGLPAVPFARESIGDGTPGVPLRPVQAAHEIEDAGTEGVAARGLDKPLLHGLAALHDDHIGPECLGLSRLDRRGDLQDQAPAGSANFGNERRRIAKGQEDRVGALRQEQVEELGAAR